MRDVVPLEWSNTVTTATVVVIYSRVVSQQRGSPWLQVAYNSMYILFPYRPTYPHPVCVTV